MIKKTDPSILQNFDTEIAELIAKIGAFLKWML